LEAKLAFEEADSNREAMVVAIYNRLAALTNEKVALLQQGKFDHFILFLC
jgi:hypothetical protein